MANKKMIEKLVRDRIPENIRRQGRECETKKLNFEEYRKQLNKKILEEAEEVAEADDDNLVDELADVLELIRSIAKASGKEFSEVEARQIEKRKERGGFDDRLFLVWAET